MDFFRMAGWYSDHNKDQRKGVTQNRLDLRVALEQYLRDLRVRSRREILRTKTAGEFPEECRAACRPQPRWLSGKASSYLAASSALCFGRWPRRASASINYLKATFGIRRAQTAIPRTPAPGARSPL